LTLFIGEACESKTPWVDFVSQTKAQTHNQI
jgi:hypothetical protein